ncbi:hypothetical protein V7S43_006056 [Phytophthora oleae]|uniref:Uncharacterized protein n=1 Tax=Phytophthora oleae TaxID=2107226 RepID=A0ABD3FR01_9STRA
MNEQDYAAVVKDFCVLAQISKADPTMIRNIIMYCKKLDHAQLVAWYPDSVTRHEAIAKAYLDSIKQETFDYEAYLRTHHEQPESATVDATWINSSMPVVASKSMSVYINPAMRDISNDSPGGVTTFVYNLIMRATHAELGGGQIQTRVLPSQITYFKLGRIILPYSAALRVRNYSRELTLTFTALRNNGIIARNGTYHFAFTYTVINDNLVEARPMNEYCKFSPPLRLVDDLSLRFNDPTYSVTFPSDLITPYQINYITSDGRFTFAAPHQLASGDVVVIRGLTATNTSSNNATTLAAVNDRRGHDVTKISDDTIAIGVDCLLRSHEVALRGIWIEHIESPAAAHRCDPRC